MERKKNIWELYKSQITLYFNNIHNLKVPDTKDILKLLLKSEFRFWRSSKYLLANKNTKIVEYFIDTPIELLIWIVGGFEKL